MAFLRYLFDHNQQVIGGLIVIILSTAALLMMRMISQEKIAETAGSSGAKTGASDLDLGAIESAFKRVLATQTVPVGAADAAAGASAPPAAESSDRDTKIQELAREIDRLTAELSAKKTEGPGFGGTGGAAAPVDAGALESLQAKITELEGKLTEYEIIEDDIADLSRFKEENAQLRSELDALKANATSMAAAPAAPAAPTAAPAVTPAAAPAVAEASVAPAAALDDAAFEDLMADLKAEVTPEPPAESPVPDVAVEPEAEVPTAVPEKPKSNLGIDEIAVKESEASIDIEIGPSAADVEASSPLVSAVAAASLGDGSSVLDDSLDTEKMLSEVADLAEGPETDGDALEGSVDTDKLLEEVSSLAPTGPLTTATPAADAAPIAPAAARVSNDASDAPVPEDDLLAEFKESNDGGQG